MRRPRGCRARRPWKWKWSPPAGPWTRDIVIACPPAKALPIYRTISHLAQRDTTQSKKRAATSLQDITNCQRDCHRVDSSRPRLGAHASLAQRNLSLNTIDESASAITETIASGRSLTTTTAAASTLDVSSLGATDQRQCRTGVVLVLAASAITSGPPRKPGCSCCVFARLVRLAQHSLGAACTSVTYSPGKGLFVLSVGCLAF